MRFALILDKGPVYRLLSLAVSFQSINVAVVILGPARRLLPNGLLLELTKYARS